MGPWETGGWKRAGCLQHSRASRGDRVEGNWLARVGSTARTGDHAIATSVPARAAPECSTHTQPERQHSPPHPSPQPFSAVRLAAPRAVPQRARARHSSRVANSLTGLVFEPSPAFGRDTPLPRSPCGRIGRRRGFAVARNCEPLLSRQARRRPEGAAGQCPDRQSRRTHNPSVVGSSPTCPASVSAAQRGVGSTGSPGRPPACYAFGSAHWSATGSGWPRRWGRCRCGTSGPGCSRSPASPPAPR